MIKVMTPERRLRIEQIWQERRRDWRVHSPEMNTHDLTNAERIRNPRPAHIDPPREIWQIPVLHFSARPGGAMCEGVLFYA